MERYSEDHFSKMPGTAEQTAIKIDPALLVIPEKPTTTNRFRQAKSMPITVNGYKLDMSRAVDRVYKYELKFIGISQKGKEKDLTRGPRNDVAVALRHCNLWKIYEVLLRENRVFFGDDITTLFYDCGINFYSVDCLATREEGEKEFKISLEAFPQSFQDFFPKITIVLAKLLAVQEVFLRDTSAVSQDLSERERSAVQFLEVATTQMMYQQQDHWIFGNKEYLPPDARNHDRRTELGGGKVLVQGMEKNVRYVGNGKDEVTPMAQIDAKKSPFFDGRPLIELVKDLCENRPLREVLRDQRLKQKVNRQLKELVVRTIHDPDKPQFFSIFGLSTESAEDIMFEWKGKTVSISDYFMQRYHYRLRYPELPCVLDRRYNAESKEAKSSYFPIEALEVGEGQRVDIKKQTPDLVEKMIAGCRLLPQELLNENERQRKLGNVNDQNPFLTSLGIRVSDSPSGCEARVLFPPSILYKDNRVEPKATGELDWRLSVPRGARPQLFLQPANPPRRWVVFLFQNAVREDTANRFIDAFIQQAKKHGASLSRPARLEKIDSTDSVEVNEHMQQMRKNRVEFVLFITRDKRDPVHDTMKLAEARIGIVTQHLNAATVEKALGNRGAEMTLDNLVMKLNLKLGGINHGLGSAAEFLRSNRLSNKIVEKEWLRPTRMFVGLDMSHSAAQSLYERQAGHPPSEPTVVGMAYTIGECVKMKGEYWMQEPRKVVIEALEDHMAMALESFKAESKQKMYPEHVVVYRGGVSEGEYAKVMTEEALAIREAFKQIEKKEGKPVKMRLTIMVVQSNSNYRVFPSHGSAGDRGESSNSSAGSNGQMRGRNDGNDREERYNSGIGDRRGHGGHYGGDRNRYDEKYDRYGNGSGDRFGGKPGFEDRYQHGNRFSGQSGSRGGFGNRGGFVGRGGFGGGRGGLGGGGNAAAQNVPPGTCVDSDVIHPTHTEFLLVPHKSIMGTARPIRCTLLVDDEPRMSMDEIEGVTNTLCYAHGIVTSPVSVPAQLYAASDLAKRGRNNWKTANYGDDEVASVASGEGGIYRNDGSEGFFHKISGQLAPRCRYKFWA